MHHIGHYRGQLVALLSLQNDDDHLVWSKQKATSIEVAFTCLVSGLLSQEKHFSILQ